MDMKLRSGTSYASSIPLLFLVVTIITLMICWASGTWAAPGSSSEIRAGSELDFRPYSYTDKDDRPTGFAVELLKTVADKMGLGVRITPGPWDKVWNELVAGELDVLPIVARTPGRESLVDFSLPHTETFDAFFVREGRPALPDLAAAAGREIVVLRSDFPHHVLLERKFSGKVVPVESIPDGLRLIAAGRHDAMLCSKLVGVLELEQAGIKGVRPGPPIPDYKRVFSFAVKKGDAELLEKLNQGLLILKAGGQYDQIYRRWLVAEEPWRRLVPYFRWSLIGLIVMAGLVVALQWLVRGRTRQLTAELAERRKAEAALQELNTSLEHRVAERTGKLQESEGRLALAAGGTGIGIFDRNLKTDEIAATEQNIRLLGMDLPTTTTTTTTTTLSQRYTHRDWARRVHPEDLPRVEAELSRCMAEQAPFESEYRVVRPDDSVHWLAARGLFQYDDQGVPLRLIGIVMDINDRKQAEEALKASVAEKENLLRELSHRTKNNMQVISGLLNLQATRSNEGRVKDALGEAQDRIQAMALVHEKLYKGGSIYSLNIKNYAKDLANNLLKSHQGKKGPVQLELELEEVSLPYDMVLPSGLIINELISNSLKHAFPEGKPGNILLSLWKNGEKVELRYRDDGPGLPSDFDISRIETLGLKLVRSLAVYQLQGTMELVHHSGTEFVFLFPLQTVKSDPWRR